VAGGEEGVLASPGVGVFIGGEELTLAFEELWERERSFLKRAIVSDLSVDVNES